MCPGDARASEISRSDRRASSSTDCVRIGELSFVVPDGATRVIVDLELTADDLSRTNRYTAPVR